MKKLIPIALISLFATTGTAHAATCESLSSLKLPDAMVTSAQLVAAGTFTQPGGRGGANQFADLPAFCRVGATLAPTKESDITIKGWLAASGRNGRC